MELTSDHKTVMGTLPFRPTGDEEATYATAKAVTDVVPFGADKVRRLLAELVAEGHVDEAMSGRLKTYRRAMTEEDAWARDDAAQSDPDASGDASVGDATTDASDAPTVALDAPASDSVGDVKQFMASVRPIIVGAPAEPTRGTCSVCDGPIRKAGRSWIHVDDKDLPDVAKDNAHKATTAKVRAPRAAGERPADAPPIFAKGALKVMILDWLRKQPAGESFTATTVAKAVGGQSGSVQFALDAYVGKGEVTMTPRATKDGGRAVKHYAAA